VHDLHELLRGRDGLQCIDADRFLLDALEKFPRELKVHIGFEQDAPDFAQSLLDIGFAEYAAPAELRKRGFEFF
jgi:hypothetical protein